MGTNIAILMSGLRRKISRNVKLVIAMLLNRVYAGPGTRERQTWIFGAFGGARYGDNSAALYDYIKRNHPEINAMWVMSPSSPDWALARKHGPVLNINSIATYVQCLRAEVHVVSHGAFDVPTCNSPFSKAFKVRLGHGITALKKAKGTYGRSIAKHNRLFHLVPVSSDLEKTFKATWGVDETSIVVTGLPRYDYLSHEVSSASASALRPRRLLYMPTWRDWLSVGQRHEDIVMFSQNINALVGNPSLLATLNDHNATLYVGQHVHAGYGANVLNAIQRQRIVQLSSPQDLFEAILECDLLITDYSSVAWDFLFQDKPVIFYHFDVEKYEAQRGAYIDLSAPLFGPTARTADAVIAHLNQFLSNGTFDSATTGHKNEWRSRIFTFLDSNNSKRVTERIFALISSREGK